MKRFRSTGEYSGNKFGFSCRKNNVRILITFYLPQTDHAGHDYGPDAPETAAAVRWVIRWFKINDAVKQPAASEFYIRWGSCMTKIDNQKYTSHAGGGGQQ